MQYSEEQILALAPDDASRKAGAGLAGPPKWVTKGINEQALWGECQGSGSKPYQTQVDLINIAFKCSCPSRKFPCKHGLGLLLLYSRQPGLFKDSQVPDWVSAWISKRNEKEIKKTDQAEKPVDEHAQLKRQEARNQKVSAGIRELLVWIKDIVRNGILNMPEKSADYWDNMARRMFDAQAAGLAAMVRTLAETKFWEENWQSSFMDRLLNLYVVAESYGKLSALNEPLQQDVWRTIGFTISHEELKMQQGIRDTWMVLGKEINDQGQLIIEHNWLYGTLSDKYALVLQFYTKGQPGQFSFIPGTCLNAELVYFPSAVPYRAIIKEQEGVTTGPAAELKFFDGWQQVAVQETSVSSLLPFHEDMFFLIEGLTPVKFQGGWWLQDQQGYLCRLPSGFKHLWKLLALSGGTALTMAVKGKENDYIPLGVWHQLIYKTL